MGLNIRDYPFGHETCNYTCGICDLSLNEVWGLDEYGAKLVWKFMFFISTYYKIMYLLYHRFRDDVYVHVVIVVIYTQ